MQSTPKVMFNHINDTFHTELRIIFSYEAKTPFEEVAQDNMRVTMRDKYTLALSELFACPNEFFYGDVFHTAFETHTEIASYEALYVYVAMCNNFDMLTIIKD